MYRKMTLLTLAAVPLLTACTTDDYGNQRLSRTGQGAAIGAAGGAVVGALTGDVLAGAAIGAAGGAIVGIVSEDRNRYEDRDGRRYYYDNRGRRYSYDDRRRKHYER
jgi:outer membrane lipoprotein SlyB